MKRLMATAAAMVAVISLNAQNLNPVVQVTNEYEVKLGDASRKTLKMNVPDSLLKFDWDFDYSVFDNPYRGAYEFNPYKVDIHPDAVGYNAKKLYLRTGVGYTPHPMLKALWSVVDNKKLSIVVREDFSSYFGDYRTFKVDNDAESLSLVNDGHGSGHDVTNKLGGSVRYDSQKQVMTVDLNTSYLNTGFPSMGNEDAECLMNNNALSGEIRMEMKSKASDSKLAYDFLAHASGLSNKGDVNSSKISESISGFSSALSFKRTVNSYLCAKVSYDRYSLKTDVMDFRSTSNVLNLHPSYKVSSDRIRLDAGVQLYAVWNDDVEYHGQNLFPELKMEYDLVEDEAVLYAELTGGKKFNSYESVLKNNHFLSWDQSEYCADLFWAPSYVPFNFTTGLSGRMSNTVQYKFSLGVESLKDTPVEAVKFFSDDILMPVYELVDYTRAFAGIDFVWQSEKVLLDAGVTAQKSNFSKRENAPDLPSVKGSMDARFIAGSRLSFGTNAEFRSSSSYLPSWIDLGLDAEYRIKSRMSVWLRGGNILGQSVMRNMLVAEKGTSITAGICLEL